MDIEEIREEKEKLASDIEDLIKNFTERTKVKVSYIGISNLMEVGKKDIIVGHIVDVRTEI